MLMPSLSLGSNFRCLKVSSVAFSETALVVALAYGRGACLAWPLVVGVLSSFVGFCFSLLSIMCIVREETLALPASVLDGRAP